VCKTNGIHPPYTLVGKSFAEPPSQPDLAEKLSSGAEAHEEEGASAQELHISRLQPAVVTAVGKKWKKDGDDFHKTQ